MAFKIAQVGRSLKETIQFFLRRWQKGKHTCKPGGLWNSWFGLSHPSNHNTQSHTTARHYLLHSVEINYTGGGCMYSYLIQIHWILLKASHWRGQMDGCMWGNCFFKPYSPPVCVCVCAFSSFLPRYWQKRRPPFMIQGDAVPRNVSTNWNNRVMRWRYG